MILKVCRYGVVGLLLVKVVWLMLSLWVVMVLKVCRLVLGVLCEMIIIFIRWCFGISLFNCSSVLISGKVVFGCSGLFL